MPRAEVVIRNTATNVARNLTSNDLGDYVMPLLQPGTYEVRVQSLGFKTAVLPEIILHVNQRARVDVELEVGALHETVSVAADSTVQADSSTLGAVVDESSVVQLPLNGRDFYQLTYLVPGAAPGAQGSQTMTQGGGVAVFGMREEANRFLLDGVDNNDLLRNQVAVPPPLDSIREFKVQSGTYGAEFGNRAGAQLNFVTKSGTNQYRLTLYEFHRNAALDAKNFFDPSDLEIPKLIRNQFGFSLGGPIRRGRTFFFGNYEALRERKAVTRLATVPPAEWLRGDFSNVPVPITDPQGRPFPGNVIPVSAMDPIGSAIAGFYPSPNTDRPGGNLISQPIRRRGVDQFVIRIDHDAGQGDDLFARYSFFEKEDFNPFDPLIDPTNIPGFGSIIRERGQSLGLGWTRAIRPNLLNDFRAGYSRLGASHLQENVGNDLSSRLGISGLSTNPLEVGFPATEVRGFDSLEEGRAYPALWADNTYQLVESLSWQKGRHSFKFGIETRRLRENLFVPLFSRGLFRYTGFVSNNKRQSDEPAHAVADLLLGSPSLALAGFGNVSANLRQWSMGAYAQDDFRITDRLTLKYGLRYDYYQPPYDVFDRLTVPDFSSSEPPFTQCGIQGIPRACYNDDRNNWGPRLGLAWSPGFASRLVVRAGYGIYYDASTYTFGFGLWENPPNFEILAFVAPISLTDPFQGGFGISSPFYGQQEQPTTYVQQWSLNIQRRIFDKVLLEVGYLGSKGTKLPFGFNPNQPRPGEKDQRPHPQYGDFIAAERGASSSYQGAWVRAQRQLQEGLAFMASYTFSKSLDDASSVLGSDASSPKPQDSFNRRAEWGLSDFDLRHRLVLNYIWEIPGRRWLNRLPAPLGGLLADWQSAGILSLQSARPFTPLLLGSDDSETDRGPFAGADRPNLVGDPHLDHADPAQWVNRFAFEPPRGSFGNTGRNTLRGPGFCSLDFALMKSWKSKEGVHLQFRIEFFNLLNRPNFDLPLSDFNSSNFGRVQSAKDSRQIQLGLRLEF